MGVKHWYASTFDCDLFYFCTWTFFRKGCMSTWCASRTYCVVCLFSLHNIQDISPSLIKTMNRYVRLRWFQHCPSRSDPLLPSWLCRLREIFVCKFSVLWCSIWLCQLYKFLLSISNAYGWKMYLRASTDGSLSLSLSLFHTHTNTHTHTCVHTHTHAHTHKWDPLNYFFARDSF